VHKMSLFPLSLSSIAFNWFTSLAPNSVDNWNTLEQRFHDYFYNGEVELRISDQTAGRQKYNEIIPEYLRRFRETQKKCYNLIVGCVLIFREVHGKSIGEDLDVDDEGSKQRRFETRAVTTPRLRWLPTCAHTNWPRQEFHVPASESRTQARTGKNNVELQMND
jgi:hypothetical protein